MMNINAAKLVYFSPTRTTKIIVEGIVQGLQVDTVEDIDLTPTEAGTGPFAEMHDELAIIGSPVYGGRVPMDMVRRLERLKANETPAVVVVVYGNRAYDDALLELKDLVTQAGFKPIAAGAFIGEHSYHNETTPIAGGRPDTEDLKKAGEFGKEIRNKMRDIHAPGDIPPLVVPGNFPYRERGKASKESASTEEALCSKCEKCSTVCPTATITIEETVMTDPIACILCCACVKNCPTGARVMESPWVKEKAELLSTNNRERKEPEVYIS